MNGDAVASVFGLLDSAVWLVTARAGSRSGGLVATQVTSASIVAELPRVLVGIARQHHTWEVIDAGRAFALHLLSEEHAEWAWRFGLRSGREVNKLDGLRSRPATGTGSPILEDAPAWLDCRVEATLDTGDRTVYLAEVLDGQQARMFTPLTASRLLQIANDEQRRMLKQQLDGDCAVDAEAIRAWRRRKTAGPTGTPLS